MNDNFYKQLIEESQTGYAYYKIICDEYGIACDYEFIEVNAVFEKIIGLRGLDIVGRRVTEILSLIRTSEFDWIHFYGDIAINGGKKEFEQFSKHLHKWYRVKAYSPEKNHFVAHFIDINEQKLAEARLHSKTAFLEAQANASLDGILVVNENQTRILTNRRIFELFNVPQYIIDDEDDTLLLKHVISLTKEPEQFLEKVKYLYYHPNETSRDEIEFKSGMVLDRHSAPVMDKEGNYYGRIWTFNDITERKRLEMSLSNEKMLLEITLVSVGDGVISTDNMGNIVFLNRVTELLTGWTQEAARGKPIEEVFNIVNEFTLEKEENIVQKVLESGKILELPNNTILISKDGIARSIEDSAAPIVQENGEIVGVVLVFKDVTEKKERQKEILYLSYHDQLTGLYNRYFFDNKIIEEMERSDRYNENLSMIILDLDHFKVVNDTWGHPVGDEVLKQVADITGSLIRQSDVLIRLGGEEFIVLMPDTDKNEGLTVAEKIRETLEKTPHAIAGKVTASFGAAERENAESFKSWYRRVDEALYRAKEEGRNRVVIAEEKENLPFALVRLEWKSEWESGNRNIDEQHHELIELANGLNSMLFPNVAPKKVIAQLDMFLKHVNQHFNYEEQLQINIGYPDYMRHSKIHKSIAAKALKLKDSYEAGKLNSSAFFSFMIDDIIVGHMLVEDIRFFPYIKK